MGRDGSLEAEKDLKGHAALPAGVAILEAKACEMSPGPCPCPSLAPVVALDAGCSSLLREVSWEEGTQERGSPGLPCYPKMVKTLSSGDVSQNESVWDGLWEGEIGLFVPSSVL